MTVIFVQISCKPHLSQTYFLKSPMNRCFQPHIVRTEMLSAFHARVKYYNYYHNPGEPVPEETFTHSHLLWSSIISYLLPASFTIHGILLVQFTCLTVFFHWSTSWPGILHFILHTFLHPIIVFFSQHMPYHCSLFCCSTEIMSTNPSLSTLYLEIYLVA